MREELYGYLMNTCFRQREQSGEARSVGTSLVWWRQGQGWLKQERRRRPTEHGAGEGDTPPTAWRARWGLELFAEMGATGGLD